MSSALYAGQVVHHRLVPHEHRFRYRMFMLYLDLAELPQLLDRYWLWSARGPALAWFRRADHLGDAARPLDESVRELVESHTGERPRGPIRLLTHLRYLGYCMNPVSFFYCFDEEGTRIRHVVAEVNNTPWGERHCYVLAGSRRWDDADLLEFSFAKRFHVSPFMPLAQSYRWRFSVPGERLRTLMESFEEGRRVFSAGMTLERRPIGHGTLAGALARHPAMTAKVIAAIYWQALRLWLKRTPFHEHPRHRREREAA